MERHAALLQVDSLTKRFGGVVAVNQVSFSLGEGTILGLIGPNGSGKTTLLNVLNGAYKPDGGEIRFCGQSTARLRAHQLTMSGISRTFQNAHVFRTVTVYQNMMVPMLHLPVDPKNLRDKAMTLLESVGLRKLADLPASELSGGQQKLVEFARALMSDPKLILMDEPFAGVHPEVKAVMLDRIRSLGSDKTSFVIVSHEIPSLMGLSQEVICMSYGKVISHGTPAAVSQDQLVIEAYLGHRGGNH